MEKQLWTTFPSLSALPDFVHAFTLRNPQIEVAVDREVALARLSNWHQSVAAELGFTAAPFATAEQVHGNLISVVREGATFPAAAADGLICNEPDVLLGIYVADCCAVYLADPVSGAFGIVHSGKKGSELNITGAAIEMLQLEFGALPENLIVQLSPCIRPPAYEVDFAANIREQAAIAGVKRENIHDDEVCTSLDLESFYSYRAEKGKTGRMLALLGRTG